MKFLRSLAIFLYAIFLILNSYPAIASPAAAASTEETNAKPSDSAKPADIPVNSVTIPGPLRSFLRMAGISQKVSREQVLPYLARNVYELGYQGGRQTEFLSLLNNYIHQARELSGFADAAGVIHISNCEQAAPLLRILGYRLRQNCGDSNAALITADADRAFLTIDSGFPLTELEDALRKAQPFHYAYSSSSVPVLFNEKDWLAIDKNKSKDTPDVLTLLLRDREIARLYWALSRNDQETADTLQSSIGFKKLVLYGDVLDFYGNHIVIRSGHVQVPGGAGAEAAWSDLVKANPQSPEDFIPKLLAKDRGWLAAYYDSLSRINLDQRSHFTKSPRLQRCYQAFRSVAITTDASAHAFRPAPALLILLTRVHWDSSDEPYVPGDLATWNKFVHEKSAYKSVRGWNKRHNIKTPEQLLETMFAFSKIPTETGPLQAYLALSELDSKRAADKKLSPDTVMQLATNFDQFGDWYWVFAEFPDLNDASIVSFLNAAGSINGISNETLRGNAMGIFQSNIGLWQIFARQGQIANAELNNSWQKVIQPYSKISSAGQLFDNGVNSLKEVMAAIGKHSFSQDELIDLLAGPVQENEEAQKIHVEMARGIRSVMDSQRMVSLDTLRALGTGLNDLARGEKVSDNLLPLAGQLREFEMPRPIFTSSERNEWAAGIYNNRHTELQMKTDLSKVLKSLPSKSQLEDAKGQLTPFLRDILVGLNYAYYEPPGAQVMHNNPLFVRSHDFAGETIIGVEHLWSAPHLFGEGSPAGGGGHLVGSLADLPYVLAQVEQNFIVPENVQALIWRELVPGLLVSATLPRWWNVSKNELHAVALYQEAGEELLKASAEDAALYAKVMDILTDRMPPQRLEQVQQMLHDRHTEDLYSAVTPADTFYLTAQFRQRFPDEKPIGSAGLELDALCRQFPTEVGWKRLSKDFGIPHPVLAETYGRELLNVQLFPTFEGYSSRLMSESWDANNLYWARLADEKGYSPPQLNNLVPQLTRRMISKIFATDFEDWRAVLRAMHETGDEFRQNKAAALPVAESRIQ